MGGRWTLYDYGPEAVLAWSADYRPCYPEVIKRARDKEARRQQREAHRRAELAVLTGQQAIGLTATPAPPSGPVAFLFPGQGAQAVGMCSAVKDLPAARALFDRASSVLGYDLLQVCLEGPKERLDDTEVAQPALFVAGLAAVERLRADKGDRQGGQLADPWRQSTREPSPMRLPRSAVSECTAAAGLSLGEYCALVLAGALSFEDALRVVKARRGSRLWGRGVGLAPAGQPGDSSLAGSESP